MTQKKKMRLLCLFDVHKWSTWEKIDEVITGGFPRSKKTIYKKVCLKCNYEQFDYKIHSCSKQ